MPDTQQTVSAAVKTVADLPLWLIIILAMASGLSGEMLRASALVNMTWKQIACRIFMRFGAATLVGIGAFMLGMSLDWHIYFSAAICIFAAILGGDVTSSLIERFANRKIDQVTPE
ncbi:MAG: holin [Sphingopyxis sp.]|nr:MAG: holin [Sphingopyxis sp.]